MGHLFNLKASHLRNKTLLLLPFFAACLLGSLAKRAAAQASYTASRHQGHVSVFLEGSRLSTDYGPQKNYGYTAGIDYTLHYRLIDPSVEFRVSHAKGDIAGQTTYMGGLKGSKTFGRVSPYGDLLFGYGKIDFVHPRGTYYGDNSSVFGAGGGVDVDIIGNLAGKAEFQYQTWKLGSSNSYLTPSLISIGVVYHLPF